MKTPKYKIGEQVWAVSVSPESCPIVMFGQIAGFWYSLHLVDWEGKPVAEQIQYAIDFGRTNAGSAFEENIFDNQVEAATRCLELKAKYDRREADQREAVQPESVGLQIGETRDCFHAHFPSDAITFKWWNPLTW